MACSHSLQGPGVGPQPKLPGHVALEADHLIRRDVVLLGAHHPRHLLTAMSQRKASRVNSQAHGTQHPDPINSRLGHYPLMKIRAVLNH